LDGQHIVGGLGRYKKGQIAILSDSEFLWNADSDYKWQGTYPLAFCDPKTQAFMKDLILNLLPPQQAAESENFIFSKNPQYPDRVFIYGNGGDYHNYSKFLNALNNANLSLFKYQEGMEVGPEDRAVIITPLKKIPPPTVDELSKSKRVILLGDMYSNIKSYADSWELFFKPCKMQPVPYPLNSLAEKYDVSFVPYFGVNIDNNQNGNILYVPVFFNGQRLHLHRACAVKLLEENEKTKLGFENSEGTFACGAGLGLYHPLKSMDPNDMENPDFMVVTDGAWAIGDSDIVSDIFFDETKLTGIVDEMIKFLK
jgi:hypothetical protein